MAIFTAKLTNRRLTLSPFSSEQMSGIGQVMVDKITDRISRARDVRDNPAKPLTFRYATGKREGRYVSNSGSRKFAGLPVRDLTLRGWTMKALKVKAASEDSVRIGFTTPQAELIIAANNRICRQWGTSPEDEQALHAAVRATLRQHRMVRLVKAAGKVA